MPSNGYSSGPILDSGCAGFTSEGNIKYISQFGNHRAIRVRIKLYESMLALISYVRVTLIVY